MAQVSVVLCSMSLNPHRALWSVRASSQTWCVTMGNYDISGSTMPVYVGKSGFADEDIIEIQDEPPAFHKGDWIGKGQQYPKAEAPLVLSYYLASLLQVPDTVAEEYIPSRNLSITNFIQKKL